MINDVLDEADVIINARKALEMLDKNQFLENVQREIIMQKIRDKQLEKKIYIVEPFDDSGPFEPHEEYQIKKYGCISPDLLVFLEKNGVDLSKYKGLRYPEEEKRLKNNQLRTLPEICRKIRKIIYENNDP